MSKTYIPEQLRRSIRAAARGQCGYCKAQEIIVGYPLHVEHIIPEAADGPSIEENLWLACLVCNAYKGVQTHGIDGITGVRTPLFNPRIDRWEEHFEWFDNDAKIAGLTPVGRVTLEALRLNEPLRVNARRIWVSTGLHPPR